MTILDLTALLAEVDPDNPVGDNLEYDPLFGEVERAAETRPEQTLGDSTLAGEPADWKQVRSGATELLAKSKDLRLAVLLTRALVNTDGWQGMSEGLSLVNGMLENYWANMHPQLDADDDNDPTIRINTLVTLCDRNAMLLSAMRAPLVAVKGIGEYSLRDYKIANGDLSASEDDPSPQPDMPIIAGAFMECDIDDIKSLSVSLASAHDSIKAIDDFLMGEVGSANAPDMNALLEVIVDAQKLVNENLARRGEAVESIGDGAEIAGGAAQAAVSGSINSRADAARMMDKISEYFSSEEPSSPVPMLMQRAKRLSNLSFLEILEDLAPDGLSQAQIVGGISSSDD